LIISLAWTRKKQLIRTKGQTELRFSDSCLEPLAGDVADDHERGAFGLRDDLEEVSAYRPTPAVIRNPLLG
jgi:hypothetical protein